MTLDSIFSENEGKSVQLKYEDKCHLVALTQQAHHGKFSDAKDNLPPLGTLDVVGRDRRNAWASLADMEKPAAMLGFVNRVGELMPHLKPFMEAQCKEEQQREETLEKEKIDAAEAAKREAEAAEAEKLVEAERLRQEEQRRQIQVSVFNIFVSRRQ